MTGNLGAAFEPSRATAAEHDASCLAAAERDASALATRDTSCGPEPDASARAAGDASQGTGGTRRICAWCRGPIPARARRDAVCCSQRCRQARHRFLRTVGRAAVAAGRPLRLAYADPPYPGNARLYRGHRDYAGEVDHAALIRRLDPYDGWALSTSAAALPAVLAVCPPGVRVAAWHRGERPTASWRPLNAWEPVIYHGGRPVDPSRVDVRRIDSLVHGVSPLTTLPGRVIGTKPAAFCRWVFTLLGAAPGDTLDDLFPGSGAVSRAWAAFTAEASPQARAERLAYADPPYPGNARLYRGHRDYANEALARCGEALNGTEEDAPLPPGQFGRVELPGYRQHTGWITEETRFGVQMAVVRDWEGREMAAATIGPNSQVVYLPTPRKRPDPVAAIEGREDDGLWDTSSSDDPDEDPF